MATITNRRARYDYELGEKMTAGMILSGNEVKSIKAGNASLSGSFVRLKANAAWLVNAFVGPYQKPAGNDVRRDRKLLLKARQLQSLSLAKQNGLHIVPLKLHVMRGLIKIDISTGRIRRKADKRQHILERESRRTLKP